VEARGPLELSRGVLAAVLAGGEGRRFGGPKQLYRFRGEPLAAAPLRAAAALGDAALVSTARLAGALQEAFPGVEVILDYEWLPCRGPLRGVATAASVAWLRGYDVILIVPGDAAWASPAALEPLVRAALRCRCTASYYSAGGHVYPLFAAGPPRMIAEAALEACSRGPPWRATGLLRASSRLLLLGSSAAGSPMALATVNTPGDLRGVPSQADAPASGSLEVDGGPQSLYTLAGRLSGCGAALAYRGEAAAYRGLGLRVLALHAERDASRSCGGVAAWSPG